MKSNRIKLIKKTQREIYNARKQLVNSITDKGKHTDINNLKDLLEFATLNNINTR